MAFPLISLLETFSKLKLDYLFQKKKILGAIFIVSIFRDKILICITQTEKFGSILRVDREIFQATENQENVFNIRLVLFKFQIFGHFSSTYNHFLFQYFIRQRQQRRPSLG